MLLLAIALSLPFVQTKIARYGTNYLNKDFGTNISVDKVAISVFGGVKLKGVLILDHHNDTLIAASRLHTNVLSFRALTQSNLQFGDIDAEALIFHLKTYKGETTSNLDVFVKKFDNGKPATGKFRLKASEFNVANGRFRLTNQNAVTPRILDLKKLNGSLKDFYIKGSDVTATFNKLSLLDHRGLFVKNMKANFTYTKTKLLLENLELATAESALRGRILLTYVKEDFKDFVNRVNVDFKIERATISSNEMNYFYNEFGVNQKYYLSTHFKGQLNDFILHDLKLLDAKESEIIGSINFRHLFDKAGPGFYMNGNFDRITSNYTNLKSIMPRILNKSLPVILEKFGTIHMAGDIMLTKKDLEANLTMLSGLGEVKTDLAVQDYNKPDNATYTGFINLNNFNIASLIENKTIGRVTLNLDISGSGFNKTSLNTTVKGQVASLVYNHYNYRNISINGRMKWPYFKGTVDSKDPNLQLFFNGLVDMSRQRYEYDFEANVEYANLKALNFMNEDSIAVFKGNFALDATGRNLNDMAGTLHISSLSYQNNKADYKFEDFTVTSVFGDNNVRTITVDSKDIIQGSITGKYSTNEISKIVQNAVGSLYTNYSPFKVRRGQFMDFNFTVYNKIVDVVLPQVFIGDSTVVKGHINADNGEFRFGFSSPNIIAYNNTIDNININIDSKNPLYNAFIQIDSIRNKSYKVSDFNLINVTQNDTLYLRTEFKGGSKAQDAFNLNLYHTIDKNNKSVVGFKKSEINIKDYLWYINEDETNDNKIIFNKKLTDFSIEKITMSHNYQRMELMGELKGKNYKDLKLSFNDIALEKVTPSLDSLNFGGRVNGEISFKQNKSEYKPQSNLTIDSLQLNKHNLGDLTLDISGDRSLKKFNINTSIINNDKETFFTTGSVELGNNQTILALDAGFDEFDMSPLEVFLKSVFPDIRGYASGRAAIAGTTKNPEVDGRLYLKDAGLKIGYLNTDYDFEQNAVIDFTQEQIFFRNAQMTDTKYKTLASLNGSVKHKLFKDWALDITIASDRMLVLDTQDSDEALYYGTAFIKGNATIKGPTTGLVISVDATSEKGTDIKIPLNNAGATGTSSYIKFISPAEKQNILNGIVTEAKRINGLEMNFELTITPDANLEIIIDKNTGHSLTANGYGLMLLDINTLGKFNMLGDFQVNKGTYNFKYGGVIDKRFDLKNGGTIVWEGDPTRARLNLEAVYRTQANPSVLLEAATFSRNIPVEVAITLNGTITTPEPDFTINFPGVSSVLKSDLEYRLADMDTRQTQALSLLSTGSFLSPTNANTAVYGSLFERASSLLNGLLSDDDSKVNVGVNYTQADRNPYIETNSQIGVTLSSQISNRITVNGQVGVAVGGVNESVIGNFELQLRLNDDNTLRARAFNRENDINFLGEGIGYTQGVGLNYQLDFDTFDEFIRKIFRKLDAEDANGATDEIPDSEMSPEYIKYSESRNKKKGQGKQPERIPETD